jgi:hypothetical protein
MSCLSSALRLGVFFILACTIGAVTQSGKVDPQFICMDFPERSYTEKYILGLPIVGFSWCENDNAIRFVYLASFVVCPADRSNQQQSLTVYFYVQFSYSIEYPTASHRFYSLEVSYGKK